MNPNGMDPTQQALLQQFQQQQLAQSRLLQLHQQFAESTAATQASQANVLTTVNPALTAPNSMAAFSFASPMHPATTAIPSMAQLANPIPSMGQIHNQMQMPQVSIQGQITQPNAMTVQQQAPSNGVHTPGQNGLHSVGRDGSPTAPKASPATVNAPATPGQMTAVSRESTSTEPCLVIADDDEHPVVD